MNVQYGSLKIYFTCTMAASASACLEGIKAGTYDITTVGGEVWLFLAMAPVSMAWLIKEQSAAAEFLSSNTTGAAHAHIL